MTAAYIGIAKPTKAHVAMRLATADSVTEEAYGLLHEAGRNEGEGRCR